MHGKPQPMAPDAVRLSWTITHVPTDRERRRLVHAMVQQLDTPDSIGGQVVKDWNRSGCWHSCRRALGAGILYRARHGATHHIMLQDDVVLCRDFLPAIRRIISLNSNNLIGLYARRAAIRVARKQGKSWVVIPDGVWGPAYVVPSHWLGIFLSWADHTFDDSYPHDDRRWCFFLLHEQRPAWCTAPSLVQHMLPGASLVGHSNRTRRAIWWIGNQRSALEVDWTAGLQEPVRGTSSLTEKDLKRAQELKGRQHADARG